MKKNSLNDPSSSCTEEVPEEITEKDRESFFHIVSIDLSKEQIDQVTTPALVLPHQNDIMAVHWHPEFVPMDLIEQRVNATFPNRKTELIIPTQHNVLMSYGEYSGVEVDCYSRSFNRKVQLLLHFKTANLGDATVLRAALEHTRKYRASQLFDFIHTIITPIGERIDAAARETGADEQLIHFVTLYTTKINTLLEENLDSIPRDNVKNKLLRNFFNTLREDYGNSYINRVQAFLKAVKVEVKKHFSPKYFFRTSEIIEEARSLGAGIVIPHPEQFWPILLAEYDVDGYEVWNPQSREFTDFLISTVIKKNKHLPLSARRHLVFTGDDTHMGEKVKPPDEQDVQKAAREIGVQPVWDDLSIRKKLIVAQMDKHNVIEDYMARLVG
ncbi:MAG: hypothetical protein KQH63_13340 [Desulfobulbaceae bacterium]|nr:hypothetical protein [Desulfobulbaceae bacterium]